MRLQYSIVFLVLIAALLFCTVQTRRSKKPIRDAVGFLEAALIPPIIGNLLITASDVRGTGLIGQYIYHLGMDLVMAALVNFTDQYCKGMGKGNGSGEAVSSHKPTFVYALLSADAVQLLLNPVFGHAFGVEAIDVEGLPYYRLVAYFGQTIHCIVDYTAFFCVLLIFILAVATTSKIYRGKYTVLLGTMIVIGLVQTYFVFSKSPIDRSMVGYGVFGIVIYFFTILYRPLRLLDLMLSNIVSDLSDSFFILDPGGKCLWANAEGCRLTGVSSTNYDAATEKLLAMFGSLSEADGSKTFKRSIGEGESIRYFELEENQVRDDAGQLNGSYLRVHDITEEERGRLMRDEQIGQISQEAYQDALTGVGSQAAYNRSVSNLSAKIAGGLTDFAVVMVDMNRLKQINDDHGHKSGDLYIRGCCHLICEVFKHSPVFRIGGDEFAVILTNHDYEHRQELVQQLRTAYREAMENSSAEPWKRYSAAVGIAECTADDNSYELVFKRADESMYEEKNKFKEQYGSYR